MLISPLNKINYVILPQSQKNMVKKITLCRYMKHLISDDEFKIVKTIIKTEKKLSFDDFTKLISEKLKLPEKEDKRPLSSLWYQVTIDRINGKL